MVPSHKLVTADYEQSSNINSFVNLSFMYYFGKYKLNIIYDDGTAIGRQDRLPIWPDYRHNSKCSQPQQDMDKLVGYGVVAV